TAIVSYRRASFRGLPFRPLARFAGMALAVYFAGPAGGGARNRHALLFDGSSERCRMACAGRTRLADRRAPARKANQACSRTSPRVAGLPAATGSSARGRAVPDRSCELRLSILAAINHQESVGAFSDFFDAALRSAIRIGSRSRRCDGAVLRQN